MLRKCMKESVVGISHPKSRFTRSWMQSISGQQCTRMFSNIVKLVKTISKWGI
jgi:hypothetical protein